MGKIHSSRFSIAVVASLALSALVATAAFAAAPPTGKSDGTPKSATVGGVAPQFLTNADTIPHWTFQYTDPSNGTTYPITMVGADPKSGQDTTVHSVIVPLKISFVAGNQDTSVLNDLGYAGFRATPLNHTFDGTRRAQNVLDSPLFRQATTPAMMGGDTAQYGDAF